MISTPISSKRPHSDSPSSTLTSPIRKKNLRETTTAIGVSRFKELIQKSSIFIDKSLLIRDFLKHPAEVLSITCPRRWGKSININMIETFLEIEVDKEGKKYPDKSKTINYKLFVEGKIDLGESKTDSLASKLLIAQHVDIINKYQGEYPVISVDFSNIKGNNYQDIVNGVKTCLHEVFQQHEYLLESSKLDEDYKELLTQFINCFKYRDLHIEDIRRGLEYLSELLYTHFGKEVFILIDEYDTPINNILKSSQFPEQDIENTLIFFSTMMGTTFKGNKYLNKGLLTGVFRMAKSSISSGFNNVVEHNFINNPFARYYGFTKDDVEYLFDEYEILREDREKAMIWYDGYIVGLDPTLKLYNPWAIVNFLQHKKVANYWEDTINIDFFKKVFKNDDIRRKIQSLLSQTDINDQQSDHVFVNLENLKFSKENYISLRELLTKGDNYEINYECIDLFFRFIFAAGYLTLAEEEGPMSFYSRLKIPNKEIRSEFEMKLISYYEKLFSVDAKLFTNVTDELIKIFNNQESNKLKQSLEELFGAFPKFLNIKENTEKKEVFGSDNLSISAINYVALYLKTLNKYGSEIWYQNKGIADIIFIDNKIKSGMVVELKSTTIAGKYFDQKQKYLPLFKKYNDMEIIKYLGISVSQEKKVTIEIKIENNPYYSV
ncbi:unnamed protein product [Brachionus calyciflorus]|uniref:AAA-ATPase-like domain-containing protein n=1 Tax=Brachionus calyciflorus TaxID=104777 RepID=A0A813RFY0_9BILA|nr:unnamed protein product [Brachionus calyciflorus]